MSRRRNCVAPSFNFSVGFGIVPASTIALRVLQTAACVAGDGVSIFLWVIISKLTGGAREARDGWFDGWQ